MRSEAKRIEQLERRLLSLEKAATGWRSGSVGARRQPRVGVTVPDATQFPTYPTPPPPLEVDEQGQPLPQPPHANVFPFLFTDASFDVSGAGGVRNILQEDRTATPVGRVCNLNRVYVPPFTPIPIFEDNGHYWTIYGASAGGSTTPSTPQLKPTANCVLLRHGLPPGGTFGTISYPTDFKFSGFNVSPASALPYMGLQLNSAAQATANCTVSGGAVVSTTVTNAGSGYVGGAAMYATANLTVGGGTGAAFSVAVNNLGQISSISIVSAGSGYANGTYALNITPPNNAWYTNLFNATASTLFFVVSGAFEVVAGEMTAGQEMTLSINMRVFTAAGEQVNTSDSLRWITSLSHDLIQKFDDGYRPRKGYPIHTTIGLPPGYSIAFDTTLKPLPGSSAIPMPTVYQYVVLHPIFYQPEYY